MPLFAVERERERSTTSSLCRGHWFTQPENIRDTSMATSRASGGTPVKWRREEALRSRCWGKILDNQTSKGLVQSCPLSRSNTSQFRSNSILLTTSSTQCTYKQQSGNFVNQTWKSTLVRMQIVRPDYLSSYLGHFHFGSNPSHAIRTPSHLKMIGCHHHYAAPAA